MHLSFYIILHFHMNDFKLSVNISVLGILIMQFILHYAISIVEKVIYQIL